MSANGRTLVELSLTGAALGHTVEVLGDSHLRFRRESSEAVLELEWRPEEPQAVVWSLVLGQSRFTDALSFEAVKALLAADLSGPHRALVCVHRTLAEALLGDEPAQAS